MRKQLTADPSRLDDGETNWHSSDKSFAQWLQEDYRPPIVADMRTEAELRRALYANRSIFEPEFP